MMKKWSDWPLDIHTTPEQIKRFDNLLAVELPIVDTIRECGETENGYRVNLTECTCMDFKARKLPCKHMYKLAQELDKFTLPKVAERSLNLIADFSSGFARDWRFAINSSFWPNLDIKYIKKKINGETALVLTQGYNFSFDVGHTFYDSTSAYTTPWAEAIWEIHYALQVHSVYPNNRTWAFEYQGDRLVGQVAYKYGPMTFDVFTVSNSKLVKNNRYTCHVDEFVRLLKEGECILANGENLLL